MPWQPRTEQVPPQPGTPPAAGRAQARAERLETFVRQDPSNLGLLLDLAGEHHAGGNLERALELAERAATLAPDSSLAAALRTLCLLSQGQVQRAREVHRAYMSTWPTPEAARRFLWVFEQAGKSGESVDDLEQLLSRPGLARDRLRVLVRALHAAGQPARALHHLAALLRSSPAIPADEGLLAARASFQQALAMDRNFAESHGALAVVDALQTRTADARRGIARALRLDRGCLSAVLAQKLLGRTPGPAGQNLHDELMAVLQHLPAVGGGTMLQFHQRLSRAMP